MQTVASRVGGRPPQIAHADIVGAGRDIGMRDLSVHAVATRLGVSATALYRHIKGRWELERLVGESLLAELDLDDDASAGVEHHLLAFSLQLLEFADRHPGLAAYLQVLFPRGDAGARLLSAEVDALGRRGYCADAAMVLASAVATMTISLAVREESNAAAARGREFTAERDAADERLSGDVQLGPAHRSLPKIAGAQYIRLLLTASIRGLVSAIPPGRPIVDAMAELAAAAGEDS